MLETAALAVAIGSAGLARAQSPESEAARWHYERAVEHYGKGEYDQALSEFNRTWELNPSYKLLYNIAQVRSAKGDWVGARQAYHQYLAAGGANLTPERQQAVQEELRLLGQRVASLTVVVDIPGARVMVDGVNVGTTPLSVPLAVNPGSRRISVYHPAYLEQVKSLALIAGGQGQLEFSFSPGAPAGPTSTGGNSGSSPHGTSDTTGDSPARWRSQWIGWSATGVLTTAAAVTGIITLIQNADLQDKKKEYRGGIDNTLNADAARVQTLAGVTDGLWVGALVAGSISLWLSLRHNAATPTANEKPAVSLSLGPRGVGLRGAF